MEILFLGTGAGSPSRQRNVSSLALKLLDERNEVWLFDVGEGTQHQILQTNIRPRKVTKIFITHLHGDHIFGLPGFLASRANQGGTEALTIYGPEGIENYVRAALKVSQTRLAYPLKFVILKTPGVIFDDKTFKVSFLPLDHRIASFGFRIEEKPHPGELLIDKVREAGIPSGPVYAQLKAGKTVKLADGRTIDGNDFIGAAQPGRTVAILGDTRQTATIAELAKDADVLVHESTFGPDEAGLAKRYYHSTNLQAAKVATEAGVGELLLNHVSARYIGPLAKQLQKSAQKVFHATRVVRDFDEIEIPFKKE
ncbi:ribonuclease Z [Lacticaseibacillus saniviri]|uniref:Ribonuclease Z n=1 Tax=Lacticaseibacillus saniviri JCM 17471 = DSM 24301 TaxID=1293598 RepID=A0A0R2N3J5_9LACO|nr:ribonuclease Z [Lacticaseibacillus saniviri]KRO18307.1 ribonuclease Z [Lacticaseibacillus saniviri JCM 17471 = DSM 24301]MCG4282708.1 ribonuclease Z [Lacticaseibacillus saniviri]